MASVQSTTCSILTGVTKATPSTPVLIAYAVVLGSAGTVVHFVAEGEFSAILTVGAMFQTLAVLLLALQVVSSGSVAGISARALILDAAALCCKLSSTLWLNGYLPVDASGDHIYQAVDILGLIVVLWLLKQVLVERRQSYQEDADNFPIGGLAVVSLVLAALLHGNMNHRPLFDALWMAGLLLGTVAVMPQLWLMNRNGGKVEALPSHYVACMALGRVMSGMFMWHARDDITCKPWVEDVNHASWTILIAHAVHLIMLADFGFYYAKAVATQGLNCEVKFDLSYNV